MSNSPSNSPSFLLGLTSSLNSSERNTIVVLLLALVATSASLVSENQATAEALDAVNAVLAPRE